ncbi:MAG: DUF512 domain-containing protein [Acutalibacteraceae bacterium]|nr:DUF512 domain-containing protein [Acutalibacteraceae bacterium]
MKGWCGMAVVISDVNEKSRAFKAGILPGEKLIKINGNDIVDVLDYRFYQTAREVELELEDTLGNARTVTIHKGEYEEIGLEFETYLMDKQHSCRNKCIFCFIDQLPKGMRDSLYFKDDDSRLSFLFGNYVTLTNLTQHEIDRIIKLHISPINVSVHTTNPELRVKMMNNRFAGKVLEVLPKFAEAGIKINCQIVACPGINDGKELERTLTDLEHLYPAVECIAVVPVGLTACREGLYPLVEYTKETATETLDLIESYGEKFKEKYGCRIVYASDEFFLKAEREIPEADYYEDFDQLDNGVGLLSLLRDELLYALEDDITATDEKTVTIACGTGVAEFMQTLMNNITERFNNVKINVVGIKNNFFGGGVDVSGLVTGQDLLAQLKDKDLGDKLLIPQVMLRSDGDLFLDDISIDEVRETLKVPVITVANNGETLLNEILS